MTPPVLEHMCTLTVELDPILEMGQGRGGKRRIVPIVGGTVEGPRLNGVILNLGADWQTIYDNGMAELDTRYAMRTHDDAIIEVVNFGYRHGPADVIAALAQGRDVDPAQYYMRTHCRLETGDERYQWVNTTLFVGTGKREAARVVIDLFAIN